MGDVTLAAFLTFVAFGVGRHARNVLVVGVALLLGVAGVWVLGLPGAAVGLVALAFARRGP